MVTPLSKEQCKIIIAATLSALVNSLGKELTRKNAVDAYYIIRGAIKNTDVPHMDLVHEGESSVLVVRLVGAMCRGLTQLTEANIVVHALGEIVQDENYWAFCEVSLRLAREKTEELRELGLSGQEVVDHMRKDIQKQGGVGPYDAVPREEPDGDGYLEINWRGE